MALLGDILGTIGLVQADQANKKQVAQDQANYALQQALVNQQIAQANQAMKLGTAGSIDAEGNQTYYDPTTNTFKATLSDKQQRLQDAADAERLQEETTDNKQARLERVLTQNRQAQAGNTADALLRQTNDTIAGRGAVTPQSINNASQLAQAVANSRNGAVVGNDVASQALRSGTTGALIDAYKRQGIQAPVGSNVDGRVQAAAMNTDKLNATADPYAKFAALAAGDTSVGASANPASSLASALDSARSGALQGANISTSGVGNAARTFAGVKQPNLTLGAGKLAANLGANVSGYAKDASGFNPNDITSFLSSLFGG